MESAQVPVAGPDGTAASVARSLRVVLPDADAPDALPLPQRTLWPCKTGQVIARAVDGEAVDPPAGRRFAVRLESAAIGPGAAWNDAHTEVIAERTGQIILRGTALSVDDKLELSDDVDISGGPVCFEGPVHVRKNVLDSSVLDIAGDLTVDGSIEAANVRVTGTLTVHHGICGKERGQVTVIGKAIARFASNAQITATGDVEIEKELSNSRVHCGGRFIAKRGSVISSHVVALDDILCETAGSSAGIRTVLEIGLDPGELDRISKVLTQLTVLHKKAEGIRTTVEPLMRNQKGLTAQQKEKATELLYMADEADAASRDLAATLEDTRRRVASAGGSHVEIGSMVHPGVIIRCLGFEAAITTAFRGPLRLALRSAGGDTCIAVLDTHNKVLTALPTIRTPAGATLSQLRHSQAPPCDAREDTH